MNTKTAFYYNHKINCMTARGRGMRRKGIIFGDGAFGLLDWGAACGRSTMNGTGPTAPAWWTAEFSVSTWEPGLRQHQATENMLFYSRKYHKLGRVHLTWTPIHEALAALYDDGPPGPDPDAVL